MAQFSKRSVVKHRTRSGPQAKGSKGGFSVGATNVPNGAYIGRAKKHKADLIHKAKVKKAYYKMLKHEGGPEESEGVDLEPSKQDLGRFAPENDEEDGLETLQPREEREPAKEPTSKPKKLPYFYKPPKKKDATAKPVPKRTKEEAIEEREARREKWNRKSPSRLGRQRGQPDLGARVEVMLERIQRQAN